MDKPEWTEIALMINERRIDDLHDACLGYDDFMFISEMNRRRWNGQFNCSDEEIKYWCEKRGELK